MDWTSGVNIRREQQKKEKAKVDPTTPTSYTKPGWSVGKNASDAAATATTPSATAATSPSAAKESARKRFSIDPAGVKELSRAAQKNDVAAPARRADASPVAQQRPGNFASPQTTDPSQNKPRPRHERSGGTLNGSFAKHKHEGADTDLALRDEEVQSRRDQSGYHHIKSSLIRITWRPTANPDKREETQNVQLEFPPDKLQQGSLEPEYCTVSYLSGGS